MNVFDVQKLKVFNIQVLVLNFLYLYRVCDCVSHKCND